jgi:RNA polymerase sigma-70 factor (ECF subfamily)
MTDKQLITLIAKNADSGLRIAIDIYGDNVYAICRSVLAGYGNEVVEEAWSDTFFRFWKYAHKFDFNKNVSLKTYICTIARNASIRRRGKEKRITDCVALDEYEADSIVDVSIDIENDFVRKTIENGICEAVQDLDEPEKSVFILRYYYFNTIKEIASKMELSAKQVENLLSRRKNALKKMLFERGILSHEDL